MQIETRADTIPKALQEYSQWVCWKQIPRENGKTGKMPVTAVNRDSASTDDPETWTEFEQAEAIGTASNIDGTDGIGFVFTEDDPFVGIDLDDCVEDGELVDWAEQLVGQLNSYTEFSPSGAGVHVLVEGDLPGEDHRDGDVEMYDTDRFFTVTGEHVEGTPTSIEARQKELEEAYQEHLGTQQSSSSENSSTDSNNLDDETVLEKARNGKKGEEFQRLWNGDTTEYDSHSEADEALCCRLAFWTGKDRDQIDRLFRQSGLMRSKWDEDRGDQAYGEMTIESALSIVDEPYSPKAESPKTRFSIGTSSMSLDQAREVVTENFGARTWDLTEAALATHATLLLDANQSTGLVFVGNSGAGKTTVLRFFEGSSEVVRSDDATPASFVSADASLTEEQLEENDLLPRIRHKTLLCRDMATWFSGDKETIREKMSLMAYLMDGEGYTRDTGSHGQRGYTGDYRFSFLGATTPLPARSWAVMGHTGNRFVFHEKQSNADTDDVVDAVFGEDNYGEKVNHCRSAVQDLIEDRWQTHGGYSSAQWTDSSSSDIKEMFGYLSKLVVHARAPIRDGTPQREGPHRIMTTLRDISRGRALLDERTELRAEDVEVCARIALSTMPKDRRPVVRTLLDPENDGVVTASQVESDAGVSRPTAHNRMEELDTLGMGTCIEADDDGRQPKIIECATGFEWPGGLPFPEFEEGRN